MVVGVKCSIVGYCETSGAFGYVVGSRVTGW